MKKAIILIGFQNDYFAKDGILRSVVEESSKVTDIINNTVNLISNTKDIPIISTPIIFSKNYKELLDPVGILQTIKSVKAFKEGTKGSQTIDEITAFSDKITEIPGKLGLNAFVNTTLDIFLKENEVEHLLLAGTVASICIDSTGRSAYEKGYKVTMLSDCISGRTIFEKDFYCESIFPLYATVKSSLDFYN